MDTNRDPKWWNSEHQSGWERVKDAFRRDWEQTKHDFGVDDARDLDQDVNDTVRQMAGKDTSQPEVARTERSFDELEPAYRYGYGARQQYGDSDWNDDLDNRLRSDWSGMGHSDYDRYRDDIRRGWDYAGSYDRIGSRSRDLDTGI